MLEVRRLQGARQGAQVCIRAAEVVEHKHAVSRHQLRHVGEEREAAQPCRYRTAWCAIIHSTACHLASRLFALSMHPALFIVLDSA